eukprot:5999199-Amphidinium_carterae.1
MLELNPVPQLAHAAGMLVVQYALRGTSASYDLLGLPTKEVDKFYIVEEVLDTEADIKKVTTDITEALGGWDLPSEAMEDILAFMTDVRQTSTLQSHDALSLTLAQLGAREFAKANTHLSG